MLHQCVEGKWIDCFVQSLALCVVKAGEIAAILS